MTQAFQSFKKLVFPLALAVAIAPMLTGCTDEEMNTAIGVLAIGAGVAIIAGAGGHDNDRHDHDHWRHHDRRWGSVDMVDTVATVGSANAAALRASTAKIDASEFAQTFGLSKASANLFLSSMERAKAGDSQAVQKLGLTEQDFAGLRKFQLPSEGSIRLVAKNIQADAGATRNMLALLIQKAAQQARNVQ